MNGDSSRHDTVDIGHVEHQTVELVPLPDGVPEPAVFVDATGRRRRWLTYLAIGNGAVLLTALLALIVGLGGGGALPLPALPDSSPTAHPQRSVSPRAAATSDTPSPAGQAHGTTPTPTAAPTTTAPTTSAPSPAAHGHGPTTHPGNGHGKG